MNLGKREKEERIPFINQESIRDGEQTHERTNNDLGALEIKIGNISISVSTSAIKQ